MASVGIFDQEIESSFIFLLFRVITVRNMVVVIKMYRVKFSRVNCGEIFKIVTIQPRWAIEENAKIFRIWVWLIPPQPPIRVDSNPNVSIRWRLVVWEIWISKAIGAIFCQVDKISPVWSVLPCRTSGSQKWNGATPSFIIIAMDKKIAGISCMLVLMAHSPVSQALIVLENRIMADAAACVKKYFVAASIARGWGVLVIRGIIAKVLISSPIQAKIQWKLDSVVIVPRAKLEIMIDRAYELISKGGGLTNMFGVWAQKLI